MSIKSFIIASLLFAMVVIGNAQPYQRTDGGIKTTINSIDVDIRFYNPSTVRILKSPEGKSFTKNSLSVILAPQKTSLNVSQAGDELALKSKNLRVNLNLKNGRISFAKVTG
jgi:alpha-D-xyloside xylohydrolase